MESEKTLEKRLGVELKKMGGWSLKLIPLIVSGLPDRILLVPKGRAYFAELKSTKKTPSKIQLMLHRRLEKMGFRVFIIDSTETLLSALKEIQNERE
jgi:hypothetical protein